MPHGILFFCTRWGLEWDTLHGFGRKVYQVWLETGHLERFWPKSVPGGGLEWDTLHGYRAEAWLLTREMGRWAHF